MPKVKIPDPKTRKIGSKTLNTVFIGYALDSNVGIILFITSEVSEIARNTIIEARNTVYFENIFSLKSVVCPTPSIPLVADSSSRSVLIPIEEPRRRGELLKGI